MSQLKFKLSKLIPRFSKEANRIRDEEARSRWMKIRKITESSKSLAAACRFFGLSEDAYHKWGHRLLKKPVGESLLSKSRKPHRSPRKVKPRIEKKVLKIRRVEPYLGPERIADTLQENDKLKVPPSTIFNILRRAKVVGKKLAQQLTKKHLKRYRRPWPGYLQMDFKYVPYLINGKKYYQLSCVDHHSSWRLIRAYRNKNIPAVMDFLKQLKELCPFPIIEIQTDNDFAFTDKFGTHGTGVSGAHELDIWCRQNDIIHRLIPVGVKELNGKVENTHKQDDREFYAMNLFTSFESLERSTRGYNERWNNLRRTKRLYFKTPIESVYLAYARAIAVVKLNTTKEDDVVYKLDSQGNAVMPILKPKIRKKKAPRPRKLSAVGRYLKYLEWEDGKKKLPIFFTYPVMSQNFSYNALILTRDLFIFLVSM